MDHVYLVVLNQHTYKVTMACVLLTRRTLSELLSTTALTSQWMTEWDSRHQDKQTCEPPWTVRQLPDSDFVVFPRLMHIIKYYFYCIYTMQKKL